MKKLFIILLTTTALISFIELLIKFPSLSNFLLIAFGLIPLGSVGPEDPISDLFQKLFLNLLFAYLG